LNVISKTRLLFISKAFLSVAYQCSPFAVLQKCPRE